MQRIAGAFQFSRKFADDLADFRRRFERRQMPGPRQHLHHRMRNAAQQFRFERGDAVRSTTPEWRIAQAAARLPNHRAHHSGGVSDRTLCAAESTPVYRLPGASVE